MRYKCDNISSSNNTLQKHKADRVCTCGAFMIQTDKISGVSAWEQLFNIVCCLIVSIKETGIGGRTGSCRGGCGPVEGFGAYFP